VFNEREKLYDEISEMYRKYQDNNKGDLDGSRIEVVVRNLIFLFSDVVKFFLNDFRNIGNYCMESA
jgi:hypothetical protein